MFWSCQGRLSGEGNFINSGTRTFLLHIADLIIHYDIDVMWLNDGRFTKGSLDCYLPVLYKILPNCRIIQFPTTYIKTGSRCQNFNRMGGAVAIITHKWHGYVTKILPDPTGSGLINAVDISIGLYKLRLINVYMVPTSHSGGPATIHSRLTAYTQGVRSPEWAKRLNPLQYQLQYLRILLNSAHQDQRVAQIGGDFNRPFAPQEAITNSNTPINLWRKSHSLHAPLLHTLHTRAGYYTWNNNSLSQDRTSIDHIVHTPLPSNISLHQVGTAHDDITLSHSDHLPVWLSINLSDPISFPRPPAPLPECSHPDLHIDQGETGEALREEYNNHLASRLAASLSPAVRNFPLDPTKTMTPLTSAASLAVMSAHSVLTVNETSQGLGLGGRIKIQQRCSRLRSNFKNGFSPHMRQLQTFLYFYTNLLRSAFSKSMRNQWSSDSYTRLLLKWTKEWTSKYQSILRHIDQFSPAAQLSHPADLWQKSFHTISRHHITCRINEIKSLLHGTRRADMRLRISPEIRRRTLLHT
jgi:hypothetical protein